MVIGSHIMGFQIERIWLTSGEIQGLEVKVNPDKCEFKYLKTVRERLAVLVSKSQTVSRARAFWIGKKTGFMRSKVEVKTYNTHYHISQTSRRNG